MHVFRSQKGYNRIDSVYQTTCLIRKSYVMKTHKNT